MRTKFRSIFAGGVVAALTGVGGLAVMDLTQEQPASQLIDGSAQTAAGNVAYSAYLPVGYADSDVEYPVIYLLHGRGDTSSAWQRIANDLDDLIASGEIQPLIAVMPDAPWNERGSWYTDSQYTGQDGGGPGAPVETALAVDLVDHIDATYRTADSREGRAVGGYSMGAAGALRFALARQEHFSAGLILSPAAYVPQPPADSSVRDYGAYGVGDRLFDERRYLELSYPQSLADFNPVDPVHLFIATGDDEWPNPDPAEATHDIDFESAKLYNAARRVDGISAELRIMNGGHDWDVWQPAFREGIVDIASRLRTTPTPEWEAEHYGTPGDDRAGGVVEHADGSRTLVVNAAADLGPHTAVGGLDVVAIRTSPSGEELWRTTLGTQANDRAYGVVEGHNGDVLIAGYSRGSFDDGSQAASDDIFVAIVKADGSLGPITQLGDPSAADRAYGVSSDGDGGVYVTGYTSGALPGFTNSGDKDVVIARISGTGEVLWVDQFGGTGEDKGQAATALAGGGVAVGGIATAGLPGWDGLGAGDAWVTGYTAEGTRTWMTPLATSDNEQVNGLSTLSNGTVLAVGHTKGTLGEESRGDNDIFVAAIDPTDPGSPLWIHQLGTSTDDRGAAIASLGDSAVVVATTYGAMGDSFGSVDVVALTLGAAGEVSDVVQFGSRERDGADEWDEANLHVAPGSAGAWVTGLTFGAPSGAVNQGAADVFAVLLPLVGPEPGQPMPSETASVTPDPTPVITNQPEPSPTSPSEQPTSRTTPYPRPGLPSTGSQR